MRGADEPTDEHWVDPEIIRPYVVTRGRTQPVHGRFDLISMALAVGPPPGPDAGLDPEHLRIIQLCREPKSVAEIAAYLDLRPARSGCCSATCSTANSSLPRNHNPRWTCTT